MAQPELHDQIVFLLEDTDDEMDITTNDDDEKLCRNNNNNSNNNNDQNDSNDNDNATTLLHHQINQEKLLVDGMNPPSSVSSSLRAVSVSLPNNNNNNQGTATMTTTTMTAKATKATITTMSSTFVTKEKEEKNKKNDDSVDLVDTTDDDDENDDDEGGECNRNNNKNKNIRNNHHSNRNNTPKKHNNSHNHHHHHHHRCGTTTAAPTPTRSSITTTTATAVAAAVATTTTNKETTPKKNTGNKNTTKPMIIDMTEIDTTSSSESDDSDDDDSENENEEEVGNNNNNNTPPRFDNNNNPTGRSSIGSSSTDDASFDSITLRLRSSCTPPTKVAHVTVATATSMMTCTPVSTTTKTTTKMNHSQPKQNKAQQELMMTPTTRMTTTTTTTTIQPIDLKSPNDDHHHPTNSNNTNSTTVTALFDRMMQPQPQQQQQSNILIPQKKKKITMNTPNNINDTLIGKTTTSSTTTTTTRAEASATAIQTSRSTISSNKQQQQQQRIDPLSSLENGKSCLKSTPIKPLLIERVNSNNPTTSSIKHLPVVTTVVDHTKEQQLLQENEYINDINDMMDVTNADDDDDNDVQHDIDVVMVPTIDELVYQCWTCGVPLHCHPPIEKQLALEGILSYENNDVVPHDNGSDRGSPIVNEDKMVTKDNESDSNDDENKNFTSLYAMHTHEVLGTIPQCYTCAELLASYEQQQQHPNGGDLESPVSYCSGCAVTEEEYEGEFLICSNTNKNSNFVCSRKFCYHCVAKCNGGTEQAEVQFATMKTTWNCPCCIPTTELQYLQQRTIEFYQIDSIYNDNDNSDELVARSTDNDKANQSPKQRTKNELDYLLHELNRAEFEKEHCCEEILSESNVDAMKLEIRQEVLDDVSQDPEQSQQLLLLDVEKEQEFIDDIVQQRYDEWYDEWDKHERRISDYIAVLLDELDVDHQFTTVMCYQAIDKMALPPKDECDFESMNHTTGNISNVPMEDWVHAANNEIDQRHRERKKLPIQKVLPDIQYEIDDFVDVEDLHDQLDDDNNNCNSDDTTHQQRLNATDGFASNQPRPSRERILLALENEKELKVQVKHCFTDDNDQTMIQREVKHRTISIDDKIHSRRKSSGSRRRHSNSVEKLISSKPNVSEKKRASLQQLSFEDPDKNRSSPSYQTVIDGENTGPIPPEVSPLQIAEHQNESEGDVSTISIAMKENVPRETPGPVVDDDDKFYDCNDDSSYLEANAPIEDFPSSTNGCDDQSEQNDNDVRMIDGTANESSKTFAEISHDIVTEMIEAANIEYNKNKTDSSVIDKQHVESFMHDTLPTVLRNNFDSRPLETLVDKSSSCLPNSTPSVKNTTPLTPVNKKRVTVDVIESQAVHDTPSKRKRNGDPKKVDTSIAQDPTMVQSQQQQQELHPATVLCQPTDAPNKEGIQPFRTIRVAKQLWKVLKKHQRDGVKFIWRNSFSDFAYYDKGNEKHCGGCILAHNMGLGKSLTTIALLHTVMTATPPLIHTVLLVVPVNTIANWENEFNLWQKDLRNSVVVTNLGSITTYARDVAIKRWLHRGGVLLIGDRLLAGMSRKDWNPDVLVLDEAHTMIKNSSTKIYKTLGGILTPRRILLSGSPIQNNLMEYYHLFNFVRPNVLGYSSEAKFDREYQKPIANGMASNCSASVYLASEAKERELCQKLEPYVQRVDSSELRKDLPPMHHVVIHVRQTRLQSKLYRAYKRYRKKPITNVNYNSFLKQYASLRPIHNHPGSLLCAAASGDKVATAKYPTDDADEESSLISDKSEWWRSTLDQYSDDEVKLVHNGNKVVLLLHILTLAGIAGDKVVIFANNIATLNYLEFVLALDWKELAPSLESLVSPSTTLGRWQKARDYLRIDGSISGSERGTLVDQFDGDGLVKAFLMSKAGGIGINLVKANRIIIIDQHFNPTISLQAIYRLYRYGQTKPVFCYSLLTQGTMEEKIYGRCVNKAGVALRVIDRKTFERRFTAEELQDLLDNFVWVQCDKCEKWRILVNEVTDENLPEEWDCSMNITDPYNNSCQKSEKSQKWYEKKYFSHDVPVDITGDLPLSQQSVASSANGSGSPNVKKSATSISDSQSPTTTSPTRKKNHHVCEDTILQHLLEVAVDGKKEKIICNHYLHDDKIEET